MEKHNQLHLRHNYVVKIFCFDFAIVCLFSGPLKILFLSQNICAHFISEKTTHKKEKKNHTLRIKKQNKKTELYICRGIHWLQPDDSLLLLLIQICWCYIGPICILKFGGLVKQLLGFMPEKRRLQ